MTIKRYTYLIIYIIATVFFAACTSDDVEREKAEGEMTHVSMTITTRATGTPETTTVNEELIGSWWVVFVNNAGNVQKIVSHSSFSPAVEEERVELDIPVGTYTLYSFANITPTSTTPAGSVTIAGFTFTEGSACPTGIGTATYPPLSNGWTTDIPMTGKQSVTVTGRTNETFSIEVVRMLAKMEFEFKNTSSVPLTVNSLAIKQVQQTPVSLLPNYTWLNDRWPFDDLSTAATTYTRTYNGSPLPVISLDAKGGTKTNGTDIFYMIESQADYTTPSQSYLMTLNVTRNSVADNLYFTLDKSVVQTIYRNDHVVIPLNIFDYIVSLDANFYPPIGGYPAIIKEDKDKDEFYITFKTQGEFEILPTVYNASTGTNVYYPNWDYNTTLTISDPKGLFETSKGGIAPTIDSSGEILGKLSTNEGTAIVDVEIKVKVSTSPEVWQVYPRRIYIIRSNT